MLNGKAVPFVSLRGKVLTKIEGLEENNDIVVFHTDKGEKFIMYHEQDCCESVSIEDVCGDVEDLIGAHILLAEETTDGERVDNDGDYDSYTWTFYRLATLKGFVDIRWYGSSNGYYSESVDFIKVEEDNDSTEDYESCIKHFQE